LLSILHLLSVYVYFLSATIEAFVDFACHFYIFSYLHEETTIKFKLPYLLPVTFAGLRLSVYGMLLAIARTRNSPFK